MMTSTDGSDIENVILHQPLTFNNESSVTQKSQDESNLKLVLNSVTDVSSWKRFDGNEFKPLHDYSNSVVLQYATSPPVVGSSLSSFEDGDGSGKSESEDEVSWCMASTKQTSAISNGSTSTDSSPTDFFRYKTRILIKGNKRDWKNVWKKLVRSLQHGELEYCNAYHQDSQEIMIYHFGWQQAQVGEWIWKNVTMKYSKRTMLIDNDDNNVDDGNCHDDGSDVAHND